MSTQSWELQKNDQLNLVVGNPDVATLSAALDSLPVKKCTPEEISGVLRLVFVKTGLRAANLPSQIEKQVLIDFIYRNYGNHKLQEVNLAFDLAIMDKLDVDSNHYENFTCKYFASIMKAYRIWAAPRHEEATKKPVLMIEAKKELTLEEWMDLIESARSYQLEAIPTMIYDYLHRTGVIILNTDQKHELLKRSGAKILASLDILDPEYAKFKKMLDTGHYTAYYKNKMILLSQKIAVRDYFDTLKK